MDYKKIKELVADDKSLEAIDHLKDMIISNHVLMNNILLIESQLKMIDRHHLGSFITTEVRNSEMAKKNLLLLKIIDQLEKNKDEDNTRQEVVVPYYHTGSLENDYLQFILRLRKTSKEYLVTVSNHQTTGEAATYLAKKILGESEVYNWVLVRADTLKNLPAEFRFESCDLNMLDVLLLSGDKITVDEIVANHNRKPQEYDPSMLSKIKK
ncbi:MAG: hypothetical protein DWQ02_28540 [Bacteroidetes bacterium]|nr:MAG: hypothetical protein DWQ02_28540 [Bacteroidota bacterium]